MRGCVLAFILFACIGVLLPAGGARAAGASCVGSASAINQYCEDVPGAGGSQPLGPGSPTLGPTLPRRTIRRVVRVSGGRWLLALPAATVKPGGQAERVLGARGSTNPAGRSPSAPSLSSLALPVILVMLGIAAALGLLAFARRRARHA
jgi:hypothetical protein